MPFAVYETDDKGNPVDDRICIGWDYTSVKPLATLTASELTGIGVALASTTRYKDDVYGKAWKKLQPAIKIAIDKES